MSKAACPSSKLTRRAAIAATIAGAAASAAAAPALAAPDPAFALVVAHKAATAAHEEACALMSELEGQIPEDKRKEWFRTDRAKGVGADDDLRWRTATAAYWATFDAEEKAAWALARARPATPAGAAALLRHAHEHEAERCEWPDGPDNEDADVGWHGAFHRSLAAALDAMGVVG